MGGGTHTHPPPFFPTSAPDLSLSEHSLQLKSILFLHVFCAFSQLAPQLGCEPHEDRDPTGHIYSCVPSSGHKVGPQQIFTESDLHLENCLLFVKWREIQGWEIP